jgi:hypothetical protein
MSIKTSSGITTLEGKTTLSGITVSKYFLSVVLKGTPLAGSGKGLAAYLCSPYVSMLRNLWMVFY